MAKRVDRLAAVAPGRLLFPNDDCLLGCVRCLRERVTALTGVRRTASPVVTCLPLSVASGTGIPCTLTGAESSETELAGCTVAWLNFLPAGLLGLARAVDRARTGYRERGVVALEFVDECVTSPVCCRTSLRSLVADVR